MTSKIVPILAQASQNLSLTVIVPKDYLILGAKYQFSVQIQNFCGGVSQSSTTVTILPTDVPSIVSTTKTTINRSQIFLHYVEVNNQCRGVSVTPISKFSWKAYDALTGQEIPLNTITNSSVLNIDPYSFFTGSQIIFNLTITISNLLEEISIQQTTMLFVIPTVLF